MKDLRSAILAYRSAIRQHRDEVGDDRCWLDDLPVWALLSDSEPALTAPPLFPEAMERCREFHRFRNDSLPDPVPHDAVVDPAHWDDDLAEMTTEELADELGRLQFAIRRHREVPGFRMTDDDRALYDVLPEKIPADFRLPDEAAFIGGVISGAGCPNFWRSHERCVLPHNLHAWGPCRKRP